MRSKNGIDQELEDAAKKLYSIKDSIRDVAKQVMLKRAFKQGADWRSGQLANDAIEFAEWCSNTHYRYDPVYKTWRYDADSYTSKQFYELWQSTKNSK